MKAVAKENLGYKEYPYVNWEKGQEYPCELLEEGKRLDIVDQEGVTFHFKEKAKEDLSQIFEFVPSNEGIYIGIDINKFPVVLTRYTKKSNGNINRISIGEAGAGMSYSCKLQMLDSINKHPNAIVIDPKGEINNLVYDELHKDTLQ